MRVGDDARLRYQLCFRSMVHLPPWRSHGTNQSLSMYLITMVALDCNLAISPGQWSQWSRRLGHWA